MGKQQQPKIIQFMKILLNHSADSVRVPEITVNTALNDIRDYYDNMRATEAYLSEKYSDVYDYPRIEFERKMEEYSLNQKTKYEEYLVTRNKTVLFEYVTAKPPMRNTGIEIYTRYV